MNSKSGHIEGLKVTGSPAVLNCKGESAKFTAPMKDLWDKGPWKVLQLVWWGHMVGKGQTDTPCEEIGYREFYLVGIGKV